jgi:assimilatory nitrate reductase catalytic subunit
LIDEAFVGKSVGTPDGFWEALDEDQDLWSVAKTCDVPPADLEHFFDLFATHPRTITLFSQGINQSLRGTDQVNAIINVHLATGRIGKPGAAPFSITGQPNAMGGREVGGLASTLASHMGFDAESIATVQQFWGTANVASRPGLKAVDLFHAVEEGRIKALWIMATNPAVSMPDAGRVREALKACPFVVVSDVIGTTDTARHAHVRLPAAAWGEKDGTVTNSERRISRQRALFPLPGEVRPDWWIVKEIACRMGWGAAFSYDHPAEIFREHARLSTYRNEGGRLFDIGRHAAIGNAAYEELEPFLWGGTPFVDGVFPMPDRRARLVPVQQATHAAPLQNWPLTLNTGRYRDQWHTMTRTGLSPKLSRHLPEPLIEIHPGDAEAQGLADGDIAAVATPQGRSLFKVKISSGQRPGEIFAPIHWTDRQSSGGRTGLLPRPLTDPHSGQPGFKSTPATIEKVAVDWRGFLVMHGEAPVWPPSLWVTRISVAGGVLYELAGQGDPLALDACLPKGTRVEARDAARGTTRIAILDDGRLMAALFVTRAGELPARDWLVSQLGETQPGPAVLAGRAPGAKSDRGPIICVCFDVGFRSIVEAITEQTLTDVAAVGQAIGAGTNCGSCRPALARILNEVAIAPQEMTHAAE